MLEIMIITSLVHLKLIIARTTIFEHSHPLQLTPHFWSCDHFLDILSVKTRLILFTKIIQLQSNACLLYLED